MTGVIKNVQWTGFEGCSLEEQELTILETLLHWDSDKQHSDRISELERERRIMMIS